MAIKTVPTDPASLTGAVRGLAIHEIRVGMSASCELVASEALVDQFALWSGDVNPLHVDASVAKAHGFPRRVAHGMVALSAISRLIGTELPGAGALWVQQDLQFLQPVYLGDRLRARVTVEQVSLATETVVLRTEVVNLATDAPVLSGQAKVRVMKQNTVEKRSPVEDRVAIVSGSSRGLGQAIAQALADAGHRLVVHCHRERDAATAFVEQLRAKGGKAILCQADLSGDAVDRLFQEAYDAFGRVDIIVNNASPMITRKPAFEHQWHEFDAYWNLYVRSAFRLAQLAVPEMQARKFGRIINIISSYAVGVPPAKLLAYVTAKSAMAGFSRALAVELGPSGVTVNMVAPSMLMTDQTSAMGDRARQLAASQSPIRRLPELDEVARAVAFLASDAASAITGAVIPVAGGEVMPC